MKLEKLDKNEVGKKVWIEDNGYFYPGIIKIPGMEVTEVYKYALGIYQIIQVSNTLLYKRIENISLDIYDNRRHYVN